MDIQENKTNVLLDFQAKNSKESRVGFRGYDVINMAAIAIRNEILKLI